MTEITDYYSSVGLKLERRKVGQETLRRQHCQNLVPKFRVIFRMRSRKMGELTFQPGI